LNRPGQANAGTVGSFIPDLPATTRRFRFAIPLGLALLVLAVYWGSGSHAFLDFDDGEYVAANPHVANGLTGAGVRWAFTAFHAANWHPVTWLSHMADVQLFGMNAGAAHRINVAIHLLDTLLLFHVLRKMTGASWRSAFAAALFGVHPLHVESVAWISERKDVLSVFFFLGTLAAYAAWTRDRRPWKIGAALGSYGLGLMSKSMLVTTPFLLLLLDFWPLRRFEGASATDGTPRIPGRRLLLEKLPFLSLALLAGAATFRAQSQAGATAPIASFPLAQRIANAPVSAARYLADIFWPSRLAVFYPHPSSLGDRVPASAWMSASLLLAVITAAALAHPRRRPWLAMGWTWYLVSLLPVIGLVQVGSQARADRYTYLPLIGIFVALAWGAGEASDRLRLPRPAIAAAAAACLVPLAAAARVQSGYWRDGKTLYAHAIAVTPSNWLAWNNLGMQWLDTDPGRAAECFRRAVGAKADYEVGWYNLGVALGRRGLGREAIDGYRRSLALDPRNADGWVNLSLEYLAAGRSGEAAASAERALDVRPEDEKALQVLVLSALQRGDPMAARLWRRRLSVVNPLAAKALEGEAPAR